MSKILLGLNPKVNTRNNMGRTPLFVACANHDNVSIVDKLINAGADINVKSNANYSVFNIAVTLILPSPFGLP